MRTLTSSFLLLLLCAPLAAQRLDNVPLPATVEQLAPATLDELARVPVTTPLGGHDEKPRAHLPAPRAAVDNAVVADFVKVAGTAAAPPSPRGFRSAFDPLPGAAFVYDPADASGAVGPRHVVGAFNNCLSVHDRNGNQLSFLSIYQFWHDDRFPETTVYDPRVMYDAANDRFVLAMLTDSNTTNGVLLFAVSATGDPTGAWQRFRIGGASSSTLIDDFTRMAFTSDRIVITANEYDGDAPTGAVNVFLIPRNGPFVESPDLATRVHASPAFDYTPVTASDSTVRLLTQSNDTILQYALTLSSTTATITRTNTYLPPVGFLDGDAMCDQLGTTKAIECDGSLLHYAILRDGVLWIVHSGNDGAHGFIVLWKVTGGSGTAKGYMIADAAKDYGYPSIAINRLGGVLVGYSTFSSAIFPSSEYRYIDPDGNVSAPATVKNGEDWYSAVRWGDYSTTVVDPIDDTNFWTLQSYTTPAINGKHSTWGTWWTYVQVRPPQRMRAVRH